MSPTAVPLHLGFLCDEYPPDPHGGIGTLTQHLGHAMVERGHRVTVVAVSRHHRGEEDDHGVRVIRVPHAPIRGTGFVVHGRRLRRVLAEVHRDDPFDLLEGAEDAFARLPRRMPMRRVIRMNGGHHFFAVTLGRRPRPWRSWLERRSFARADDLCAVGHFVAEETRRILGLGDRPITVIPNAVDTDRFRPSGRSPDPHRIAFVGTVCAKKGVAELTAAMATVLSRHPDTELFLAGRDWLDGHGRSFTEGVRAALDGAVADHIHFVGPLPHDDVPAFLDQAAICVLPSHMEALPIAWLEAMAAGRPVVAGRPGPGPEVIDDGVDGLLCDPHDPASIAARVIELLDDPARATAIGGAARRTVVDRYALDVVAGQNEAFYTVLAGATRQ